MTLQEATVRHAQLAAEIRRHDHAYYVLAQRSISNRDYDGLEGHDGLASGSNAVLERNKSKYRRRDYTDRGSDDALGLPDDKADRQKGQGRLL